MMIAYHIIYHIYHLSYLSSIISIISIISSIISSIILSYKYRLAAHHHHLPDPSPYPFCNSSSRMMTTIPTAEIDGLDRRNEKQLCNYHHHIEINIINIITSILNIYCSINLCIIIIIIIITINNYSSPAANNCKIIKIAFPAPKVFRSPYIPE